MISLLGSLGGLSQLLDKGIGIVANEHGIIVVENCYSDGSIAW